MTSTPGSRKPAPKTKRSRPAPASPVQPAEQDARSNRGARLSALEAKVGALESELKKSERRLRREVKRREGAESELRRSEARFQSLAAFGDHHLFVMDPKGRYLFSNREQGLSVGGELLPLVGRNQRDFHPPEVADQYEAKIQFVLETRLGVEFAHAAPEPDGLHYHLDTLYPIVESGRIVALGGICRDVTDQKDTQHRLGRSEERFRRVFDLGLIGMAITSVDKGWLEVNDRLCEILGYPREELTRKSWAEVTHPEDLPADVAQFERVLAGAIDAYSMEKRFIRKDGRIIHAEISAKCLRRPDRSVEYFVACVQDITERKRASEQLRASEQRLQWALDATAEGIWDWNIRTGDVVFSRNWKTSLGYSPDEVPDRIEFWESIVHPEDLPRVRQALDDHFAGRTPVYVCENRLRMKSGEYRANIDRGMVVEWDESGKPVRMVGTDTDITDANKAHNAILEANQRLEAIFNASHQAVLLIDTDGIVIAANEELARRLHSRAAELIGKSIYGFLPDELSENRKKMVEEAVRTRQALTFEDTRQDHIISQTVCPVFDAQGNVAQLAVYAEDVTDRRRSEQALRRSEEKYRQLFENSLDGIFLTVPDGTIVDANPAACAMFGMSKDEVCRAGRDGIVEQNATLAAGLRERERTGSARGELNYIRKDGSTFVGETSAFITAGQCGTPCSFVIVRDITERKRIEQTLRESEEKYRRIVETASEGIWSMDGDYRTTYVNRHMADMLGYAPEEMIGRRVDAFMFAEDLGDHATKMAIRERGEGGVYERRFRRKDGRELWTMVAATALKDAEGNFAGSFAMFTDVTERRQAEQALLDSELRYRIVADNTYDWECWLGPDGAFLYSSSSCERITGFSTGDFLRSPHLMREIVHPDDRVIWDSHRCWAAGGQGAIAIEFRITRADGDTRWIEHVCQPVFDPAGKHLGARASNRDATERKRSEEATARSEFVLNRTQQLAGVGGWEWDVNQQTMFWTQETYRIHDLAPGELTLGSAEHVARSLACYDTPDRPRITEAFRRCAEEGVAYDIEVPFTSAKGRRMWVRTTAEAVVDHGRVAAVIGNIVDITERKRLEEILQVRLRLSEAVATLSLEDLLQRALDEAERLTGSCIGFIHFVEEDQRTLSLQMWSTNTLEKMCTAEGKGRHYDLGEAGVWVDCIHERRPVVHNDYAALPHRKGLPAGHAPVVRQLAVPILRNDRIVAVLGVGNKPQGYDEYDVETVESLANLAWDIVLRKKAEEQLELQGMVLDQTSDRVCITDLVGVIRYVNEAECLALNRSRSELIGSHVSVFGEDAKLGATQQEVIDSTLANSRWRGEVANFASNGAQTMVDLRTFLVRSPSGKAIAMCGIGTDITELKKTESELRLFQGRLRDLYHQLQNSREDERQHISRKIHDELGQNITALQIDIGWLKRKIDPAQSHLHDKLELMTALADSTLETVRRVSAELRPGILDALGLAAAVDWLIRDFEHRNEIPCSLLVEPEEIEVEQNLATDMFRVLQEALTNVARHARASSLQVTLRQNEGMLELEVADDGIGISEEKISRPGSLGLLGIRERLMAHGGDITLRRLPGRGTRFSAVIPIRGKEG